MQCCDEQYLCSYSCLIDEGQTFLLTGGSYSGTRKKVSSRYNINGWMEDLDDLNTGRWSHGCTQFTNNDGDKVRMEFVMTSLILILFVQVNIVCGGWTGSSRLDSCEKNRAGTKHWRYTRSLPRPLDHLRGVTLDNRPLMTGE